MPMVLAVHLGVVLIAMSLISANSHLHPFFEAEVGGKMMMSQKGVFTGEV